MNQISRLVLKLPISPQPQTPADAYQLQIAAYGTVKTVHKANLMIPMPSPLKGLKR